MKIEILSDLHLEFGPSPHQYLDPIPLIIAGDLHVGIRGLNFLEKQARLRPVVYILGNHEFYHHDYDKIVAEWKTIDLPNLHFLHNSAIQLEGVRILGTILWTDMNFANHHSMRDVEMGLTDFQIITFRGHTFKAADCITLHNESREWLESELKRPFSGKTVVVSHHLPSEQSIAPEYATSRLNPGFFAHCDDLIKKYQPDLWIHGHTHGSCDYWVEKTHVVCNPLGYPHERNPNFQPHLQLEL